MVGSVACIEYGIGAVDDRLSNTLRGYCKWCFSRHPSRQINIRKLIFRINWNFVNRGLPNQKKPGYATETWNYWHRHIGKCNDCAHTVSDSTTRSTVHHDEINTPDVLRSAETFFSTKSYLLYAGCEPIRNRRNALLILRPLRSTGDIDAASTYINGQLRNALTCAQIYARDVCHASLLHKSPHAARQRVRQLGALRRRTSTHPLWRFQKRVSSGRSCGDGLRDSPAIASAV